VLTHPFVICPAGSHQVAFECMAVGVCCQSTALQSSALCSCFELLFGCLLMQPVVFLDDCCSGCSKPARVTLSLLLVLKASHWCYSSTPRQPLQGAPRRYSAHTMPLLLLLQSTFPRQPLRPKRIILVKLLPCPVNAQHNSASGKMTAWCFCLHAWSCHLGVKSTAKTTACH
jgi:hypothetical protein